MSESDFASLLRASARRGRGVLSNAEGRFEPYARNAVDDGWGVADEALPPLKTTVQVDRARTVIVHQRSPDIPFEQSINPYRGCEHGCVYCLSGDTLILMGDGSLRPLAEVRVGDVVHGTVRQGWYRRYVKTRVLDHWSVIKQAYRITLEDGTRLVAGADHRFFTERGWKFVADAVVGSGAQRPHLTTRNKLMGTGAFARPPTKNHDYRRGYLCGLIRGDGLLASYHYQRAGRAHGDQHQFRLALCDTEALQRAQEFLRDWQIATHEFVFQAMSGRRVMHAIRTHAHADVEQIRALIAWSEAPSAEWSAGFLAGIFDAEGSYSQGVLRISNTDKEIIARIGLCLRALDFRFSLEHVTRGRTKPVDVVRLNGGLREHLRFFHSVDPAITRKREIAGQAVKSNARLRVVNVEPLGKAMRLYDISTETEDFIANGVVSHNCYARPSHAYLGLSPGLDFETRLFVKPDAAKLLTEELRRPGYRATPIAFGTNTDPYQPVERRLRITRALVEVLAACEHPLTIVTKSALVERDLDLLAPMATKNLVQVFLSVTTLDRALARTLEPRAAAPQRRIQTIRAFAQAGVPVGVLAAPMIPALNDHELESILGACAQAGAREAGYTLLRLPHEVKNLFQEWLGVHMPDRAAHVMSLIRQARGGRENDPNFGSRMRGTGEYAALLRNRFQLACRRLGLNRRSLSLDTTRFRPPVIESPQLSLL